MSQIPELATVPNNYQPKGGMCMSCQHKARDCASLPFASMPVIDKYGSTAIVRCIQHLKLKDAKPEPK